MAVDGGKPDLVEDYTNVDKNHEIFKSLHRF